VSMVSVDVEQLYTEIDSLQVNIQFREELGFHYLKEKLGEVIDKIEVATNLMVRLYKLNDALSQEISEQRALYELTGVSAHKQEMVKARDLRDRLRGVALVLKTRRDRLRALPHEVRLYVRVLEDALKDESNRPGSEDRKRVQAVPSALSQFADTDRASGRMEDLEGLFR
jgi:hypothetical protein